MSDRTFSAVDRAGVVLSVVCLIHCLALPLVLTGVAVWWTASTVHVALALAIVPLAALAGVRGVLRHRMWGVGLLLGGGAALLIVALLLEYSLGPVWHVALTALGGILLVIGHLANWRLSGRCAARA